MTRSSVFCLIGALFVIGCSVERAAPLLGESQAKSTPVKLTATPHLPNAFRVHPKVISGGLPEGEVAFKELQTLGVKTIISVDGARPDVELARRHGMRYVHLPHGYDGITGDRAKELAKAVRDLEGPIYIHCHHGKHRSPAATAVACVSAGLLQPTAALAVLTSAGTSPNYRGLYDSVETARRIDDALLDALAVEYRETADVAPLAEAMVSLEHTHDHLKVIAAAGWVPPAAHPDLEPAHEALLLREHFTEMLRTEEVRRQPNRFQELLKESEAASTDLEMSLDAWKAEGRQAPIPRRIADAFERVSQHCVACHKQFRDVPLREKAGR
jgi:protein tyrosine phosphatase (PTP) superfamily phosphohydrolase (DUF442 family)